MSSRELVPITGADVSVLQAMGLSQQFPQLMRELSEVMALPLRGSRSGSIDLTVYPDSDFPVLEQRLNPSGKLHLRVRLEPSTKKVKIRVGWQDADSDNYESDEYSSEKPLGYWFKLADLRGFVREVFPSKSCDAIGRSLSDNPVTGKWDFFKVRVSSLERFFWKCSNVKYTEEERSTIIGSDAEWEVVVQGEKSPFFYFRLIKPYTQGLFLVVPFILWEGLASKAEGVMGAFTRLIAKSSRIW